MRSSRIRFFNVAVTLSLVTLVFPALIMVISAAPSNAQSGSVNRAKPKLAPQELLNSFPGVRYSKEIPINFPIPPYQSNVVSTKFAHSTKGSPTAAVNIITRDQPETVFKWYQNTCRNANWLVSIPTPKLMNKLGKEGRLYMISAQKEKQQLDIFCTRDNTTTGTAISISWSKKKR